MTHDLPSVNENVELWRDDLNDPLDPENAYADRVYVTPEGKIGIVSGGHVEENTPWGWIVMVRGRRVILTVSEE